MLHPLLAALSAELRSLSETVSKSVSDDRTSDLINGNWTFPRVDRHDLSDLALFVAEEVERRGEHSAQVDEHDSVIEDFTARIAKMRGELVPNLFNAHAPATISSYMLSLYSINNWISNVLKIGGSDLEETLALARNLKAKVRQIEGQIRTLEPSVENLSSMMGKIVETHDAASQFPHDLEELKQGQRSLAELSKKVESDHLIIKNLADKVPSYAKSFEEQATAAEKTIALCESAMRISTSYGLASAFEDQAKSLRKTVVYWIIGLVAALAVGAFYGGHQLSNLVNAFEIRDPTVIWARLVISVLSVGAPIWLAWLATKQIGQRFRLAEDYAYKASISKAYEGYRKEAAELDPEFQSKLFASALARLDEQPLRFVEAETHGSPWHELLASETVKEAIKVAPELALRFAEIARQTVTSAKEKGKVKPVETAKGSTDSGIG